MGWSDMGCTERFAKVMMVLCVMAMFIAFVLNCYIIYLSVHDTWFTRCEDCKDQPVAAGNDTAGSSKGTKDCTRCCEDCTIKDEIFFYIMRAYNMMFLILAMLCEFKIKKFMDYAKICSYYFPRGFLHIFIGIMTITASLADPEQGVFMDIIGYAIIAIGLIYFLLGCCCLNEYSETSRQKQYQGDAGTIPSASNEPRPASAPSQYDYKYNGQSYTYGHTGPSAI